jgi:murein hydrolase activator
MNLLLAILFALYAGAGVAEENKQERAKELQAYLSVEKPHFEEREAQRKSVLEELDKVNQSQNQVRSRISEILANRQELQMALDNLSMEVEKHRALETEQQKRFFGLMKVVNKIRRDGPVRFALSGGDLSEVAGRVRVLFRTLRMHSMISDQIAERSKRLKESEKKLSEAREGVHFLLQEMQEQESLLRGFLSRKKEVLVQLNRKQDRYRSAAAEWTTVSKELNELFQSLEADRGVSGGSHPKRRTLELPLLTGRLVKGFGKQVHPQFGTVTFHKGIEIEAEQSAPVHAILDGMVEFEGWVRGLGNVVILHHGGGFYSLHAHLHKTLLSQGAPVKKGESIGLVGDTGNNEKPSLYFELRENGKAVDPAQYLSSLALKALQG